eukprot:scaffold34204_cov39-Attheya_sp.AAC.2
MGVSSLMTWLRPLYLETMSGTISTFVYGIASSAAWWEALLVVKATSSIVEHRNRLGRQVVQNEGKLLNIPTGPTSDRHITLQTNGLPHTTVHTNTNTCKSWYNKYTITTASHTLPHTVLT